MLNVRGSIHLEIKLTKRNICLMHPMSSCWYNRCLRAYASLLQPAALQSSKYNFDEISKDLRKSNPLCLSFVQVLAFHVFTRMALLQCLRLWNIKSKSLKRTVQFKIRRQLLLEEGTSCSRGASFLWQKMMILHSQIVFGRNKDDMCSKFLYCG